jgi:two-component system NtrC family sensor kinase
MFALKTNVLVVGLKNLKTKDLAVESIEHWSNLDPETERSFDVLLTTLSEVKSDVFEKSFDSLRASSPQVQIVLLTYPNDSIKDLQRLSERLPIFRIRKFDQMDLLESDLLFALEEAQHLKQEIQLERVVNEQNEKLKSLYRELEDRVEKRQAFLLESRRKTHIANARWESLKEAMIAIYRSSNTPEMETNLLNCLQPTLQLGSIRIVLKPFDQVLLQQFQAQKSLTFIAVPILKADETFGTIFFVREVHLAFQKEEVDFLNRISEAISLAVDRQSKLEESAHLKEQWQATFNSVSEPVVLVNSHYEIIQTNSSFLEKAGHSKDPATGKKCYRMLFQRSQPCAHCNLGKNFRLDISPQPGSTDKTLYDVFSQQVPLDPLGQPIFVNLYQDVTEQTRIERKILDSARLAEIGTIGSSIAHELNNPLGGILSFVQLIRMDLPKDDPLSEDIRSMEEGVLRCRDIIENLLNFTRNPLLDEDSELDLEEVIQRTNKIIELQTRSRGIEVKISLMTGRHPFRGHLNLLSQAFRNLFQVSIDSIIDHSKSHRGFQGVIELREETKENEYCFRILDNGLATEQSPHLGLSIARQIFHDYGGKLEISQKHQPFKWVQISLPRPVFQA